MTRINCVPVQELTRQHLQAEYREIHRVFALVRGAVIRGERPKDCPDDYRMGPGHVRFFYPRLKWILRRQAELYQECRDRGIKVTYKPMSVRDAHTLYPNIKDEWYGDWEPSEHELAINRRRINERLGK